MINVDVNLKNYFIGVLVKPIPNEYDCECDKTCKIGEYSDIKNSSWKKHLFDELVLTCGDEILSITKVTIKNFGNVTSIVDKKRKKIIALFTLCL